MADHNGTVGKGQIALANYENEGVDGGGEIILSISNNEGIIGDGEIVPVKWEGSCPEDYGEVVRAWPKLVRTN